MKLIKENFVPVAADDWYQRRRRDPVGRYFRFIVEQVRPRPNLESSLQGIYIFTATGELLAHRNSAKHVGLTHDVIQEALRRWHALPGRHTRPDAFKLPEIPASVWNHQYAPKLPEGGRALRVVTRALERAPDGQLIEWESPSPASGPRPAYDHAWLKANEIETLVRQAKQLDSFPMADPVTYRLARFHLVDNTRGEPDHWKLEDIETATLNIDVVSRRTDAWQLELSGSFHLEKSNQQRGYVGHWRGWIDINPNDGHVDRFDLFALGNHWGEGRYTPGARPGKTPLGVAMRLIESPSLGEAVPPQAMRSPNRYFNARSTP